MQVMTVPASQNAVASVVLAIDWMRIAEDASCRVYLNQPDDYAVERCVIRVWGPSSAAVTDVMTELVMVL